MMVMSLPSIKIAPPSMSPKSENNQQWSIYLRRPGPTIAIFWPHNVPQTDIGKTFDFFARRITKSDILNATSPRSFLGL
jgi:hypothetical protein